MADDLLGEVFGPSTSSAPPPIDDVGSAFGAPRDLTADDTQFANPTIKALKAQPEETGTPLEQLHAKLTRKRMNTDAGTDADTGASVSKDVADVFAAQEADRIAHADTWTQTGSKILSHIIPTFKRSAGGLAQFLTENAGDFGGMHPMSTEAQQKLHDDATAWAADARANGSLPGQKLAEAARKDLEESGFNPGDSTTKKYAGLIADSAINMVPSIVTSIAATPLAGAAVIGVQSGGERYAGAREDGRTPGQAALDGVFSAAINTIGAEIPLKVIMKPGGSFLAHTLQSAGAGSAGNMLTTALQDGYDAGVLKEDMTWGEAARHLADAGIVGGVVGGAFGAASHRAGPGEPGTNVGDIGGKDDAFGLRDAAPTDPTPGRDYVTNDDGSVKTFSTAKGAALYAAANKLGGSHDIEAAGGGTYRVVNRDVTAAVPDEAVLTPDDHASPIPNDIIAAGRKAAGAALDPDSAKAKVDAFTADPQNAPAPTPEEALASMRATTEPVAPDGAVTLPTPEQARNVIDQFVDRTGAVESGGKATATNGASSATGTHQFLKGTWLSLMKSTRPQQVAGMSDDQILALRGNPIISAQMAATYANQNADALRKGGHAVDEGNLYLSHFLGAGGADAVLKASPNQPIATVLPKNVIDANGSILKGKTAGDVVAWAHARMGTTPAPVTAPQTTDQAIEGAQAFITRILGDETGAGGDVALASSAEPADIPSQGGAEAAVPAVSDQGAGSSPLVTTPPEGVPPSMPPVATPEPSPIALAAAPTDTPRAEAPVASTGTGVEPMQSGAGEGGITAPVIQPRDIAPLRTAGTTITVNASSGPFTKGQVLVVDRATGNGGVYFKTPDGGQLFANSAQFEGAIARGALAPSAPVESNPVDEAFGAPAATPTAPLAIEPGSKAVKDKPLYVAPSRAAPRARTEGQNRVDVLTFLADHGGLGGESVRQLRKGFAGREMGQYAPGGGHIFRKNGMSIDDAGELLHESGWFPNGRPTPADVLDPLHRAEQGPIYHPEHAAEAARAAAERNAPGEDDVRSEITQVASDYGEPLTRREIDHMMSLIANEGMSAHDAFVTHFEMEASDILEQVFAATHNEAYDVPQAHQGDPGHDPSFDPHPAPEEGVDRPAGEQAAPDAGDARGADTGKSKHAPELVSETGGGVSAKADAQPSATNATAPDKAGITGDSKTTDLAPKTKQPERTMTQAQRGELDARQQQQMARRGGQEAVSDQSGGLFSTERDQGDLLAEKSKLKAETPAKSAIDTPVESDSVTSREDADWQATRDQLRQQLAKLGLEDKVVLNAIDRMLGDPGMAGSYDRRVISVALDSAQNPSFTLDHEVIHALRDMGLFKSAEWTALEKAARGDTKLIENIRKRYADAGLDEDGITEEAVADMFARWRAGREMQGFIRNAFQRIGDLFAAIRRLIAGSPRAADIMRDIEGGEVGAREGGGGGNKKYSIPAPGKDSEPNPGVVARLRDNATKLFEKGDIAQKLDDWRTNIQDQMLPLLRTQGEIETRLGASLPDEMNPYLQEELMSGKVGSALETLHDDHVEPLIDGMKETGVSLDELETYLYARHAPERNARISEINPAFEKGTGSGMTDGEAAEIMKSIRESEKMDDLKALAARVDDMLKFAVDTRVESGLLSKDEAEAWANTYRHYVPLRGTGEIDPDAGEGDRPRKGSGINVKGKESRMAFGRKSRATNILAHALMQAEEAIIRAGTNEVGKALYALAEANPDPDLWTVDKITRKPVFNKAAGRVVYQSTKVLDAKDAPYTVSLKIDGTEHRVTMNAKNEAAVRLATAMRNLDGQQFGAIVKYMGALTRAFSSINTRFNPAFFLKNIVRDIQEGLVISRKFDEPGFGRALLKDWPAALAKANKGDGEWAKWRREFEASGGKVYFNAMNDVGRLQRRIDLNLRGKNGLRTALGHFFDTVEHVNDRGENALRLAVFKNARERGYSAAQAASMARNITVNFTRRGKLGPLFNSAWAFFNASVQGSANLLLSAGKSKRVRRALLGLAAAGAALDMLNSMVTDKDEDGQTYWDKIPDFEKSTNIIVMIPGTKGRYVKMPLGLGIATFFNAGRFASSAARGAMSPMAAAGNAALHMIDSFNPIGGGGSPLNMIAPTAIDPAVDIATNKDFTGKPIQPNQMPGEKTPAFQNYFASVNPVAKWVSDMMNKASGGDDVQPGFASVSPNVLQYLFGYVTGGTGRFAGDLVKLGTAPFTPGTEVTIRDIPFANTFVGEKPSWVDKSLYYDRVDQITQAAAYEKQYRLAGETEFGEKNAALLGLQSAAKNAHSDMKDLRKQRTKLILGRDKGDISRSDYADSLKDIRDREQDIITRFNTDWNTTIGK